jgi:hypothetical protein
MNGNGQLYAPTVMSPVYIGAVSSERKASCLPGRCAYRVSLQAWRWHYFYVQGIGQYVREYVHVRACACLWVSVDAGARKQTCASACVALLIHHATRRGLSGSTNVFDVSS